MSETFEAMESERAAFRMERDLLTKFHVIGPSGEVGLCGLQLGDFDPWSAADVPEYRRCRRRACALAFGAAGRSDA